MAGAANAFRALQRKVHPEGVRRGHPCSMDSRALMRRTPTKAFVIVALLFGVTALAACGESAQDKQNKAKAEVCDARNEVSAQITKLQGLTLSSNTVNEAKASFEAIDKALKKAKDARSNLAPARKEQVESALKTLEGDVSGIGSELASDLTKANVESGLTKFKSAVGTFAAELNQDFAPLNCS